MSTTEVVPKKRGRPRKNPLPEAVAGAIDAASVADKPKTTRKRTSKTTAIETESIAEVAKPRTRKAKIAETSDEPAPEAAQVKAAAPIVEPVIESTPAPAPVAETLPETHMDSVSSIAQPTLAMRNSKVLAAVRELSAKALLSASNSASSSPEAAKPTSPTPIKPASKAPATKVPTSKVTVPAPSQNPTPTPKPAAAAPKAPASKPTPPSPTPATSQPPRSAAPVPKSTPPASATPSAPKPKFPIQGLNAQIVSNLTTSSGARPSPQEPHPLPPNYKSVARKVTLAIVALPIAIVTSYVLWQRLAMGEERKLLVNPFRPDEETTKGVKIVSERSE